MKELTLEEKLKRINDRINPPRAGSRWTDEELFFVLNAYTQGTSISSIAEECKRSEGAIRSVLRKNRRIVV